MFRKRLIKFVKVILVSNPLTRLRDFVVRVAISNSVEVHHGGIVMQFADSNPQIRSRNRTFSSKEPMTLRWIESFEPRSVFWDIGANVGIYSVYAALKSEAHVVAFEPSVFNLEFLARNINLNGIQKLVTIIPLAVGGQKIGVNEFYLPSLAWGDSQNSYGEAIDQSGQPMEVLFSFRTLGAGLDEIRKIEGLPQPRYLKIDVDGLEPEILESGDNILKNIDEVLVERPNYKSADSRMAHSLEKAGFVRSEVESRNELWIQNRLVH